MGCKTVYAAIALNLLCSGVGGTAETKPVEILLEKLRAESAHERETTAIALGCLGDPAALAGLRRLLDDEDKSVRATAAASLLKLGESSEPVRVALDAALRDEAGLPSISISTGFLL